MTKRAGVVFLLCCWAAACHAAAHDQAVQAALRSLGQPLTYCPKVTATNVTLGKPLPAQVAVHKVIPWKFSEELIDQILRMTDLERRQTFQGANRGVFGTPGVRYFGNPENNHTLAIIPTQGWMNYMRLEAIDDKGDRTLTGPSEEEALRRALEFAKVLGLKESDLARHPTKDRLDYLFNKVEGGPVSHEPRVKARGVFLRRAIDGYPVTTGRLYGGLWVEYGFHGVLYKFELLARASEPMSTISVAPVSEQLKTLAESRRVYAVHWPIDPAELKKQKDAVLDLSLVELVYFEDAPDKFQKVIPPLLRWEGELKFQGQEHAVILFTPIKEAK